MKLFVCLALLFAVVSAEYKKLSPEAEVRLKSWDENSKEHMWQMSGQVQGDMVFGKEQFNGVINEYYRWPNREIPYEFAGNVGEEQRQLIRNALTEYAARTCMNVRERNGDYDYVLVTADNTGCWSYVGRQGGQQQLNLQYPGCHPHGTILHEFLHAFGFEHMQCATDRDNYVYIAWENIQSGMEHNFNKYDSNYITNYGEPYDYGSIMHYDRYAFSWNGQPTIIPHDPNAEIGQNNGLSYSDIIKLEKMYGCR